MLLTPHILTGAAIMTKVQNPILGLFLAFLSHYFLDLPPQQEYSIKNVKEKRWSNSRGEFLKVFIDISLGFLLVFWLVRNNPLVFAAGFLAILPDGFTLLSLLLPENKVFQIHNAFHQKVNNLTKNKEIPVFWGIISQVLIILIAIFFLR